MLCFFVTVYMRRVTGDVISITAGLRRHLVDKTLRNVFHCNIAETCFVGKLVIIPTVS